MRLRWNRSAIALLSALAIFAAGARADDGRDHDVARQAVERGEIKPLAEILQMVRDKLPGEIAGVKIERKGGRLIYELRIVCWPSALAIAMATTYAAGQASDADFIGVRAGEEEVVPLKSHRSVCMPRP